jgi:Flp pilus assembly protein TadD
MPVTRGVALSLVALVVLFTLGPRAAGQVASDPAAQIQAAAEYFESASYDEAMVSYDLAIQGGDPALVSRARKGKIRTALRIAEFDLALAEAEALNADPTADAESQTLLGDALWASGLFDEADAAYRSSLSVAPESSRAKFGLARSLATRNRLDDALAESLAAAALAPQDAEIHALVGLVHERLGQFEEAADAYDRFIALLPTTETSSMATISQSKVRLLRSFKGRIPLEVSEADQARVHRVPFRMANRKIVVRGRVNRTPVEFVLDTGSERTGISDATARRARVATVTATLSAGVGQARLNRLELGRVDTLEVGSLRIRNVPVAIRGDARNGLPRWQSESFSPLSLGYSLVVDYERREVLMSRALPNGPADIRLPMRMNRLPLVRGVLNSTHPAYFVVDTGGELISISADTALSLAMPPTRRIPLRVFGMSGLDENAFLLPGVDLDFDDIEYRKVGLAVLNLRAPSILLGFQLGGIVGHSFLSEYRVSMDVGRSELRLEHVDAAVSR